MSRPDNLNNIRERIQASKNGSVFVASDFADITENVKIGVSLSRLEEEGLIKRIMRGVYYKPEYSKLLGENIAPSPNAVANAIARNYGWSIVPCGDTALNLLGLSTQVPVVWLYVSDGPYKEYSYDNTTIKYKHTTNKEISKLNPKTALVIQALKTLGKDNIRNKTIERIKEDTTISERKTMLKEAQYATAWIYEVIKLICR
jgi:predicted transcriptional regulator of viral defense system